MNTNQVRPPTLPHLNLTISLWAGHFYTVFTDDGVNSERASNYPRTCQSTAEPGSAGLQRLTLLLGQGCKAPGGVTVSKIFSKNVPSQETLNCLIFGLFVFWLHRLFNCAKIYTVLKFPLYVKGYDSTQLMTIWHTFTWNRKGALFQVVAGKAGWEGASAMGRLYRLVKKMKALFKCWSAAETWALPASPTV